MTAVSTDKGVPLAPSEKDLKPWYSSRKNGADEEEESRDVRQKEEADEKRYVSISLFSGGQILM